MQQFKYFSKMSPLYTESIICSTIYNLCSDFTLIIIMFKKVCHKCSGQNMYWVEEKYNDNWRENKNKNAHHRVCFWLIQLSLTYKGQ